MQNVETVEWGGHTWRRYPDSARRSDRVYFFRMCGKRPKRLHRAVWEHHRGPVPPGHHVHHVDGDPGNNAIENLECITAAVHLGEHGRTIPPERRARLAELLAAGRPAASAWHRSEEGRAWHAENGRRVAAKRVEHDCVCSVCGGAFRSKTASAKVCGANCRARKRRESGLDDVDRICAHCGKSFRINRYQRTQCCSRTCGRLRFERGRAA